MDNGYHDITRGRVDFLHSRTRENLMRAFAGESQARNRYTFAASQAKKNGLTVLSKVFEFTAEQERAHAKVFYELLADAASSTIAVDGTYPVDIAPELLPLLRAAQHNEYQEWEHDYAAFAREAREEGFELIGRDFEPISLIEKTHGDRFGLFADLPKQDRLFAEERERGADVTAPPRSFRGNARSAAAARDFHCADTSPAPRPWAAAAEARPVGWHCCAGCSSRC